jgi:hypothetical protein
LGKSSFLRLEELQLLAKTDELLLCGGPHEALSLLDPCTNAGNSVSEIGFPMIFAHELAPFTARMAAMLECTSEYYGGMSAWSFDIIEGVSNAGDYRDSVAECKTKPRNCPSANTIANRA